MKIAVVQFTNSPCIRCAKVVRSMLNAGHEVTYVGNRRGKVVLEQFSHPRLEFLYCGPPTVHRNLKVVLLWFYWIAVAARLAVRRFDAIYAADLDGVLPVALLKRLGLRTPLVYDIYDTYADRYAVGPVIRRILRWLETACANQADLVVHVDPIRIDTVPTTSPVMIVRNVPMDPGPPAELPSHPRKMRVLLSGSLEWRRGVREIVEACRGLEDVQLIAIGVGPPEVDTFLREALGADFMGPVPTPRALEITGESDVITAFYDPRYRINILACPNKVYDAMATARVSFINSELVIASSLVSSGLAVAAPYHDRESIRKVLQTLARNPEERRRLSERSRREFETIGDWAAEFMPVLSYLESTAERIDAQRA